MLTEKKYKSKKKPRLDYNNLTNTIIDNVNIENLLNYLLDKDIPIRKSKEKINNDDVVLNLIDYKSLLNINYNLNQLKTIAKNNNVKVSGNKEELKKRIYNFLLVSHNVIIIQKNFRKKLIYNYLKAHGPGFINKKLCGNIVSI